MNYWKDIWDEEEEPPRDQEIFFLTGDGEAHIGMLMGYEKLRKCEFHSFKNGIIYQCGSLEPLLERVLYWFPFPEIPKQK